MASLRVRLYHGDSLEADTDPDAAPGAPGSEPLEDLGATCATVFELVSSFHAGSRVLGFSELVRDAYVQVIRERARGAAQCAYSHGYLVAHRHGWQFWRAQVDIALSQ